MKRLGVVRACAIVLAALAVAGCNRDRGSADVATTGPEAIATAPAAARVELEEVLEITPQYVIGITYPETAERYPRLAAEMERYAEAARAQFMEAVRSRGDGDNGVLYDLSLSFTEVLDSPQLVAYAAEGSSFTGGAHGMPVQGRQLSLRSPPVGC